MKKVVIIFKKELKDTLRDKRTLMTMLLLPLVLYPVIFSVISGITQSQTKKSMAKTLEIGYWDYGQIEKLRNSFEEIELISVNRFDEFMQVESLLTADETNKADSLISTLVLTKKLDAFVLVDSEFNSKLDSNLAGLVKLFYNSTTDENITRSRIQAVLDIYKEDLLKKRFAAQHLDRSFAEGIIVDKIDTAPEKQRIGKFVGGFLPYFFIIFCFMGSMYPAIDLGAGEKERGTIETILVSPATRKEILFGKIGVIMLTGIFSALISILGILLTVNFIEFIPTEILDIVYGLLSPKNIIMILVLLLPLSLFFASFLFSMSIYAKSYKEAQSIITPMIVVVIMPAIIGLLPGIELNHITALIPVLNVSLVTKDLIGGTLDYIYMVEALITLTLMAGIGILFSVYWFGKEGNILRG